MCGHVYIGRRIDSCNNFWMTYRVIKTVKGRRYVYEQRTWREGKRMRTESVYIGPADGGRRRRSLTQTIAGFIKANMTPAHGMIDEEEMLKVHNARAARDQEVREKLLNELHEKYGLRLADTPRPATHSTEMTTPAAQSTEAEVKESPSSVEGQGLQSTGEAIS